MKIVVATTLYPNSVTPRHGIFIETRLAKYLEAHQDVSARVVAPVPWFPSSSERFGEYATYAAVPARETWNGIEVLHPRYPVIPKVGMLAAPFTLGACLWRALATLRREFDFDLVDAHYFYPDGVSAAWVAKRLGRPCTVSARGSDLTVIANLAVPRHMVRWAARNATHAITVSEALRQVLLDMGEPPERVTTMRNGVDLQLFKPPEKPSPDRRDSRPYALCVGHLNDNKGQHLVIDALARIPGVDLVLAGDGPDRSALAAQAGSLGLADRVRFTGTVRQHELVSLYADAAMLVLASATEGWPNVLLESMACGTPVVATSGWGMPEIVREPTAGVLVERSVDDIGRGIRALLDAPPASSATRAYAEGFSWDATVTQMDALFRQIVGQPG